MAHDLGSDTESFMNSYVSHKKPHKPPVVFSLSSLKEKGMKNRQSPLQDGYYVRLEGVRDSNESYRPSNQCRDLESRTTDFTLSDYSTKKGFFKNPEKSKGNQWEYHNDMPKNTVSKYTKASCIKQMILESQNPVMVYAVQTEDPGYQNTLNSDLRLNKKGHIKNFNAPTSELQHKDQTGVGKYSEHQNFENVGNFRMENKKGRKQKRSRERKKKKDRGNVNSNPIRSFGPSAIDLPATPVRLFFNEIQTMFTHDYD